MLYTGQVESREAMVVPDIVTMIQSETDLTRRTIVDILLRSGRVDDIAVNPQSFITQVTAIIKRQLQDLMQHGLAYEKRDGQFWQARLFRSERSPVLENSAYEVTNPDRTVYDVVEFDSTVESNFVKRLDSDQRVRFYVKLPRWFTVDTPIGKYNPDWAIMMESGEKFYLVRETNGSLVEAERRGIENAKIAAARMAERAHARFLRTVRMLTELRRAGPVFVGQAGQVNVGQQQVNVTRGDEPPGTS